MVGFTYQLGNLESSPIMIIESYYGERYDLEPVANGTKLYDYGRVIAAAGAGLGAAEPGGFDREGACSCGLCCQARA